MGGVLNAASSHSATAAATECVDQDIADKAEHCESERDANAHREDRGDDLNPLIHLSEDVVNRDVDCRSAALRKCRRRQRQDNQHDDDFIHVLPRE